jgi:hypothetical protein
MEQPLPYATPALAKAVWEHQSSASARSVARALGAAGYPVHWVTVARWRRTGWQPIGPARRHPLALARAGLESVAPVVTGIPTTSIKDLIKEYPNRESLEKLTDAELLRMAACEVAMAVVMIARTIQARASFPRSITTKTASTREPTDVRLRAARSARVPRRAPGRQTSRGTRKATPLDRQTASRSTASP